MTSEAINIQLYSLEMLKPAPGDFFIYHTKPGEEPLFGTPVRQIIEREEGGGYIVSAIGFDESSGKFYRMDYADNHLLRALPTTTNILGLATEPAAKKRLLNPALIKHRIGKEKFQKLLDVPIPERPDYSESQYK